MAGRARVPDFFQRRDSSSEEAESDDDFEAPPPAAAAGRAGRRDVREVDFSSDDDFVVGNGASRRRVLPSQQGEAYVSPPRSKRRRADEPAAEESADVRERPQRSHRAQRQHVDREWTFVRNGQCVLMDDLDSFFSEYSLRKAAGAGFTSAGQIDRPGKNNSLVTIYSCKHKGCPALVRVVKHDTIMCGGRRIASVERAGHKDLQHNNHLQDASDPGVPAFVKAVLSPMKLEMKPGKLRSWLRREHPEIVVTLDLKRSLKNLHDKEMKKVSPAPPSPALAPRCSAARISAAWLAARLCGRLRQLGADWLRGDGLLTLKSRFDPGVGELSAAGCHTVTPRPRPALLLPPPAPRTPCGLASG